MKSGFIALLGSPNVGKSTLINALVGNKIAIVSKKAQTTRNKIVGILTKDEVQMVFLDTPGLHTPNSKLGEFMVKTAKSVARDVDVAVFLVDAKTGVRERDAALLEGLSKGEAPLIIAINKSDAVDEERLQEVREQVRPYECEVFEISALEQQGLQPLLEHLGQYLIEGPMFYPEDMITDQPERILTAELIREKALKGIGKEIPHGIGVEIEKMSHEEKILRIHAVIYCEKDSHKGIIIGAGGRMLKKIGTAAREDMESIFGEKVFLQLFVKVKPDWRNKAAMLRTLGYVEE